VGGGKHQVRKEERWPDLTSTAKRSSGSSQLGTDPSSWSGRDAYTRYGDAVRPLLERHGAEVLYAGEPVGRLIGDDEWDVAVISRYPSRAAVAALVRDPDFEAAAPLRHEALEAGLLYGFDA
jgi:uncharacterized protein (DUF1330 family)